MLTMCLLVWGCDANKEPEQKEISDYRDKYLGEYWCRQTGMYHCGDSTAYYDTVVWVTVRKSGDSMIHLLNASIKLAANDTFGGGFYPDPAYHGIGGHFDADSVYFVTYKGGLGCGKLLTYEGKKR
jgi:hypothetical protein